MPFVNDWLTKIDVENAKWLLEIELFCTCNGIFRPKCHAFGMSLALF